METKEHKCLSIIIEKFQVYDVDWLNFAICKDNPLTYHHRIPKREGGLTTLDNCVPLGTISHSYFHVMERKDRITFRQLSKTFYELYLTEILPNEDYFDKVEYYKEKYEKKKVRIYIKK